MDHPHLARRRRIPGHGELLLSSLLLSTSSLHELSPQPDTLQRNLLQVSKLCDSPSTLLGRQGSAFDASDDQRYHDF